MFITAFSEAVQEGLDGTGPSITDAVLFYMQKKAALELDGNDFDPETFDGCLKGLLGWGAGIVEKRILERLYQKLEIRTRIKSGFVFAKEVEKARKLLGSSEALIDETASELENVRRSTRKSMLVKSQGQTL